MNEMINSTYRIISEIGHGGMSVVYKAEHVRLGTIWAVKVVKKSQGKFNYLAEANILKKLKNPMLPQIVDIFEDADSMYVVEEFVEGETLESVIEREKVIDEKQGLLWFHQLAEVLNYLHHQKPYPIIYRDMKPGNVMVEKDGSLKVIDFGIAREFKAESKGDTVFAGTRGYGAPEQFGTAQTDARTDIYSLGVTMYHLLTGKSPYEKPYNFVPARQLNPKLSVGMETILDKCIQQEPEDRYPDVDHLLNDLNHIDQFDEAYHSWVNGKRKRIVLVSMLMAAGIAMIAGALVHNSAEAVNTANSLLSSAKAESSTNPDSAIAKADQAGTILNEDNSYIVKAGIYYTNGDYQSCIDYIKNTAFKRDSLKKNPDINMILGDSYYYSQDYQNASDAYETCIDNDSGKDANTVADYKISHALSQLWLGNIDTAQKIVSEIEKGDGNENKVTYVEGCIAVSKGDYVGGEQKLTGLLSSESDTNQLQQVYYVLAKMYRDASLLNQSDSGYIANALYKEIDTINDAVTKAGMQNNPTMWEMAGDAYYKRALATSNNADDLNASLNAFQKVLKLNIQKDYIYIDICTVYMTIGDHTNAQDTLNKMETLYPKSYKVNLYRSLDLIAAEGEKDQSSRNYQTAYSEYQEAEKKFAASGNNNVDDSMMEQLRSYIQQLKDGGWL